MASKKESRHTQLPLFVPESNWQPPKIEDLPETWEGISRIAFDTETMDPKLGQMGPGFIRGDAKVIGISLAFKEPGTCFYIPIAHPEDNVYDVEQFTTYLRRNIHYYEGEVVGANLSYDLESLASEDMVFANAKFFRDVLIADPLLNELQDNYSLDEVAKRHGFKGKEENLLDEAAQVYGVGKKTGMWKLPARFVGPYAEEDARLPLELIERQEKEIRRRNLTQVFDLESRVIPILAKMRRRGVRIDMEKLSKIEEWSIDQEREALQNVQRLSGVTIEVGDVWKADVIAPAIERATGETLPTTSTGKPQVNQEIFSQLDHEVIRSIEWARKVNKLRTTFAHSIRQHSVKGRIHCTFNQMAREEDGGGGIKGARYGRLSCMNPNMQQQPSRDEFAKHWRSIYIPDEGMDFWACCDYSQQEPRWTTEYANMMGFDKADIALDRYINDPNMDNHAFMAELTGLPRKSAKAIFLGLCYGKGGASLCDELGLETRWAHVRYMDEGRQVDYYENRIDAINANAGSTKGYVYRAAGEEGQRIIDQFDAEAPYIRQLSKAAEKRAKSRGRIRTVGGRELNFPRLHNGEFDFTYRALNRLIQGSSADQMKRAMVLIEEAHPDLLQLQVHDELDFSCESVDKAKEVAEIMSTAFPSKVPFKVDVEVGPNWGEVKEVS